MAMGEGTGSSLQRDTWCDVGNMSAKQSTGQQAPNTISGAFLETILGNSNPKRSTVA